MKIRFWSTSTGAVVDFLPGDRPGVMEIKSGARMQASDARGLGDLAKDHPVEKRILVHGGRSRRLCAIAMARLPACRCGIL